MSRTIPDYYDYVRRYYGVPAYIGMRVRIRDREGVLVAARCPDQYLHVLFDGDKKPRGPYHPTDQIVYLDAKLAQETPKDARR